MTTLAAQADITRVITDAFEAYFPNATLVRVTIRDRTNENGEGEIDVGLVVGGPEGFDAKKAPAFISSVVSELNALNEDRFPIISFLENMKRKRSSATA